MLFCIVEICRYATNFLASFYDADWKKIVLLHFGFQSLLILAERSP